MREFVLYVLDKPDLKKCRSILSNYVVFKPFTDGPLIYLTTDQVDKICTHLANSEKKPYYEDVKIDIAYYGPKGSKVGVATVLYRTKLNPTWQVGMSIRVEKLEGKGWVVVW